MMEAVEKTANIVGSGVNGLSAAIVLAQAGVRVTVYEAESTAGGSARTLELTLPGFRHDFGAAVMPLGAGSPFLSSLPLEQHGLEWLHAEVAVAHPLESGEAAVLFRELDTTCNALGADGAAWQAMVGQFVARWSELAGEILQPMLHVPSSPWLLARFGAKAMQPASWLAADFRSEEARALWAGIAAHAIRPLDALGSSAAGLALAVVGHVAGWPLARGGTQSVTNALVSYLVSLGGSVQLDQRVANLADLPVADLTLCDVTPQQMIALTKGNQAMSHDYLTKLHGFRSGPGAFKLDYAMAEPIPWRAAECRRALTVHLGGSFAEIADAEHKLALGEMSNRPYVLVCQPTLVDASRAPAGRHIAWAYCHVPYGFRGDATRLIEDQMERFAPGFRDVVLARSVLTPAGLAAHNANLHGGDLSGGAMDLRQMFFRPTARGYATSDPKLWLCSASTPPGGGVHGMCGANAARAALRSLRG